LRLGDVFVSDSSSSLGLNWLDNLLPGSFLLYLAVGAILGFLVDELVAVLIKDDSSVGHGVALVLEFVLWSEADLARWRSLFF
jgi:hypothetical protein